ncbi:hypothetical protein BC834DRAFT_890808 [Gloeopeniophorella convolvens]|nr:hypothetical protein BC834DRAFT_890808 [Gloeopeniophorella convolvens]
MPKLLSGHLPPFQTLHRQTPRQREAMVARHFLCCLPLRLGALLISLVQVLFGGLIAAAAWYTLTSMRGHLSSRVKWAVISAGIYYTILTLVAFFGFIGTILRKASLLGNYAYYLGWSLGVQIVLDAVYIWSYFSTPRDEAIQRCIDGSTDSNIQKLCHDQFNAGKWTVLGSVIIGLLVQAWAAYIVSSYATKLKQEGVPWESGTSYVAMNTGAKYAPAGREDYEEAHASLTGASYTYPYSDTNNSYGNAHPYRTAV